MELAPPPPGAGILTTETLLRTAQAEIDELRAGILAADQLIERLRKQIANATLGFAALVFQLGGEATITQEEMRAVFSMKRKEDPATHALTYKVEKREPAKPNLVVVPS